MRFVKFSGLVFAVAMTISATAMADEVTDATEMVKKAVSYIKKNGKEKALAEFTNASGDFKKGELYIFVVDSNGKTLAHGANPRLVGKDLMDIKDVDGKPFVKAFIDMGNTKGSGWVDYKWVNPTTKAIEFKSTYVQKVDDFIVACGIYKK